MLSNIKVVIGANFGDEGKGMMTDYFAYEARYLNCVVVLHNGGAQRGHTVVTPEGYRHVFHHFGSGTFAGAATYLSEDFIVNPALFKIEYDELAKLGYTPRVYIHPNCRLTTIYDMLINQVIEADRGAAKHGSCGVGIFETLYRNNYGLKFVNGMKIQPMKLTVQDFKQMTIIDKYNFLNTVRKYYTEKRLNELNLKRDNPLLHEVLSSGEVFTNYIKDFTFMLENSIIADDEILNTFDTAIFENGQGLLLDCENMEYYPHLTPSHTGLHNPMKILNGIEYAGDVEVCYVTRIYLTRHGAGRLDNECPKEKLGYNIVDMTNVPNPFQDTLRYAPLNSMDLYKRIKDDLNKNRNNKIKLYYTIAVTHNNEYIYVGDVGDVTNVAANYISDGMTRESISNFTDFY